MNEVVFQTTHRLYTLKTEQFFFWPYETEEIVC